MARTADRTVTAERAPAPPPALVRAHRVVAAALATLVLLQAVVAGRSLFGTWDIEVHGWMGNGSFALGIAVLGLAVATRAGRGTMVAAAALVVLLFSQVGLGYVGRSSAEAAAWHVPLGVAIFGLATAYAAAVVLRPTTARR